MQYKTIKNSAELREVVGEDAELFSRDKTIIGARVGKVHFALEGYAFAVRVETPFEEAKRYRVTATHPNFEPVILFYENEWEAAGTIRSYEEMADVTIEKEFVTVQIDDSGEVVQ